MKTLFISIASPIGVRNFLLIPQGVFSLLKKSGVRIVILVPEQAFAQVKKDFEEENVVIEAMTVNWKKTPLERLYTFFATYLVFTEMQRLLAKYGTRADIPAAGGRSFLYPIKVLIVNTLGKWNWFKNTAMLYMDSLVHPKRPYKKLFDKYKPDLIFLPDFHSIQDTKLMREAKRQEVRTIGMPGSWDHFVKKFEPLKLDTLLVWNEPVKGEAVNLQGYREKDVYVTGAPYYDLFEQKEHLLSREAFCKKFNLDSERKIIFFGGRSKYTPNDGDIVDIMLRAIKEKQLAKDAQIFVRPYPGIVQEHKKFDQFENEPLVYIDWIEATKIFGHSGLAWYPELSELVHFMNCLYHADVIVNTYSSFSIEGSVFLKPIININFDGYDVKPYARSVRRFENLSHFKHIKGTNGISYVDSKEELISTLNNFLDDPKINREGSEDLRDKMCFKVDGKASERISNHIINVLK